VRRLPAYVWTLAALFGGIAAGGASPHAFTPVAVGTRTVLSWLVRGAPFLIVGALSPAFATLVRRQLAGRFLALVLTWFVVMSIAGGLIGLFAGAVVFRLPLHEPGSALGAEAHALWEVGFRGHASTGGLAVAASVAIGGMGAFADPVYALLRQVERGLVRVGALMGLLMAPLVLALGVMLGVEFGARVGMSHYGLMVLWSATLAAIWWLFYGALVLPLAGRVALHQQLVWEYVVPTALFAASTCSSLATIPVNMANLKRIGVREEVTDCVVPIGAIVHKGASAMQYMAYGPLIAGAIFGLRLDWLHLGVALPFVVIYSMAAPGVPGAMGLSLWTGVLYAALLGLDDPLRTTFVGTWVALTGGVPDMFRSSGNATADGFSAIVFSNNFDRLTATGARPPSSRGRADAVPGPDDRGASRRR
jgi:Na+/H+-dicarboxylate symporter